MKLSIKHVMPYQSVHLRVPEYWREEGGPNTEFVHYHGDNDKGGPLRIRRDDFSLDSEEVDVFGGREFRGMEDRGPRDQFIDTFDRLEASFAGADVKHRELEDMGEEGRLFSYQKTATEEGESLFIWGWVRGKPTGDNSFTIVSFSYPVPARDKDSSNVATLVGFLDKEVRKATILSLDQAEGLVREAISRHLAPNKDKANGEAKEG